MLIWKLPYPLYTYRICIDLPKPLMKWQKTTTLSNTLKSVVTTGTNFGAKCTSTPLLQRFCLMPLKNTSKVETNAIWPLCITAIKEDVQSLRNLYWQEVPRFWSQNCDPPISEKDFSVFQDILFCPSPWIMTCFDGVALSNIETQVFFLGGF